MTTITRWDPMRDWLSMTERMGRLFGETARREGSEEGSLGVWAPAVDVKETVDGLQMSVELPGMDPKDVEVSVENNRLSIKGERSFEQAKEGETYHRVERAYGAFERSFTLPSAFAGEKIEAKAKDGVLTLTIPKREEAKPKSIKVKIESK
jgi:HSP20 family protein